MSDQFKNPIEKSWKGKIDAPKTQIHDSLLL